MKIAFRVESSIFEVALPIYSFGSNHNKYTKIWELSENLLSALIVVHCIGFILIFTDISQLDCNKVLKE
jgi:hypothetical protein